jgi:stage II sporulation SpoE-like protein
VPPLAVATVQRRHLITRTARRPRPGLAACIPIGEQRRACLTVSRLRLTEADGDGFVRDRCSPGDLILLYSDGLIERRHRSLDDGLTALTTAAAGIDDPEDMISAVLDTLGSTDTEDDTCLVILYVR